MMNWNKELYIKLGRHFNLAGVHDIHMIMLVLRRNSRAFFLLSQRFLFVTKFFNIVNLYYFIYLLTWAWHKRQSSLKAVAW